LLTLSHLAHLLGVTPFEFMKKQKAVFQAANGEDLVIHLAPVLTDPPV